MNAGKAIAHFQKELNMSNVEVAAKMAITPQQFSRWRNHADIKLTVAAQICDAMGVELLEFARVAKGYE